MIASDSRQSDGIEARCRQGLTHAAAGRHDEAAASYLAAWALLPEPREERSEARWILSAIVGAALARGCQEQALSLHRAAREAGGEASPTLRLRIAEVCLALGLPARAREELALAVARGGPGVLQQGDPACRALLEEAAPR
ncbi:MAG TPA: hypothetical protein VFI16_03120 [Anaeromyxobacteraceae bacterium]|nr:hypothetical protein [Anaeromyxobacteraceae bacterium]